MYLKTEWKARGGTTEQTTRMFSLFQTITEERDQIKGVKQFCWFQSLNGQEGFEVLEVDANSILEVTQFVLYDALSLTEFFEFKTDIVLSLDESLPPILRGLESLNK